MSFSDRPFSHCGLRRNGWIITLIYFEAPRSWLEAAVAEVVEQSDAVRLGPEPDGARAFDVRVVQVDVRLAVQHHLDALAGELDAQGVPGILRHRCLDV